MKTIFLLFLINVFATVNVNAWIYQYIVPRKPGEDNTKCFDKRLNMQFDVDKEYLMENDCYVVKCTNQGDNYLLRFEGCILVQPDYGINCRVLEDKSLLFPKCCPSKVCD